MENLRVYIAKEDREYADKFTEAYTPHVYQGTAEQNLGEIKKRKKTTTSCRFCKKSRTETTFKQDTHLISKLLGNTHYYSSDECDECNQLFRLYESDLAAYLGTTRVWDHFRTDIAAPGFESANGNIRIKKFPSEFIILAQQREINDINVDFQKGEAKINIHSQKYNPSHIYRALTKMGFGILPLADLAYYNAGLNELLSKANPPESRYYKKVLIVETDLTLARPFVMIFKKSEFCTDQPYPAHIVSLYTGRLMFQFFLPGNDAYETDKPLEFIMPTAPYVQLDATNGHDNIIRKRTFQDFSSTNAITKEESVQFNFAIENLAVAALNFNINDLLKKKLPEAIQQRFVYHRNCR